MNTRKDWRTMKRAAFVILVATLAPVAVARADDWHMRSGQTVEGTFLGADARQIKFLGPDGQPKTYGLADVEGVSFAAERPAPAPKPAPPPKPTSVTVLAGTNLLVRMVDSLDT